MFSTIHQNSKIYSLYYTPNKYTPYYILCTCSLNKNKKIYNLNCVLPTDYPKLNELKIIRLLYQFKYCNQTIVANISAVHSINE